MEAQELRIGNLISRRDFGNGEERFETIIELGKKAITTGPIKVICDYDDIKPIPLTEEWLLKFGWVWNKECNSYEKYPNGDARMHLVYKEISGSYTMFNYVLKALIAERIIYVHQLQNLFYCIAGEELTIKETTNG